jgi:ketosteroid isomerase-like protein
MSQENEEIARQVVEAVNRRDAAAFLATLSPNVEWEDALFWTEGSRTYRGRAEVRQWFDEILELWESFDLSAGEIVEAGEGQLIVGWDMTARGKQSGVETQLRFWTVSRIADGKIATRRAFLERTDAIEAAGLSE